MSEAKPKERKRLWAPWRMAYIQKDSRQGCVFCEGSKEEEDAENHILFRNQNTFVMLNRFPYAYGHLLVSPIRHVGDIEDLHDQEFRELMRTTRDALRVLRRCLSPEGFNVGINLGAVAGAGYADHLHVHIVPRWQGDHNFMPVLANTHVISEHLDHTFMKLKEGFELLASGSGDLEKLPPSEE